MIHPIARLEMKLYRVTPLLFFLPGSYLTGVVMLGALNGAGENTKLTRADTGEELAEMTHSSLPIYCAEEGGRIWVCHGGSSSKGYCEW